jgi:hypothetical protein
MCVTGRVHRRSVEEGPSLGARFDEKKATQIAARFLSKFPERKMRLLPFVKYMYVADRRALERWGYPLTWDCLFSLPEGPVQSCVLDLARGKKKTFDGSFYWDNHIGTAHSRGDDGKDIPWKVLESEPEENCLPPAVERLIDEIVEDYDGVDIVTAAHRFGEHTEIDSGRVAISYADVLREVGCSDNPDEHGQELEDHAKARALLNC